MAWKLKKWKGAEAEEDQPSEEGVYDISGAAPQAEYPPPQAPPAHVEPEPSQAFDASSFAEKKFTPQPAVPPQEEPGPSVIAMAPSEPEAIPAATPQTAYDHDLDTQEPTFVQPADFSDTGVAHEIDQNPADYYAESVAHADEAIAAFQQAAANQAETPADEQPPPAHPIDFDEEPIAFEIEPPGQAVANLHERPVFSDPDSIPAAPQSSPAAPAPRDSDSLGAFAPYQPVPPPANAAAPPPPVPSAAPPQQFGAQPFEDDISFAPPFAARLVVRIGPFSANYELDKPEFTIGRPDPKTGNSPDIGLEWDDAVSRRHARILRRPDGDYVEDIGSSNGTLLNGQPIAVNTPILLKNGDIITIGERTQISYVR